jgi:uncharacterized membrane protein YphA (DoxX/SURF4 family)
MKRTRLQAVLAAAFLVAATVTAAWPSWLESLGYDPDHGNGTAEWAIVAVLALLALWSGALATRNSLRLKTAARLET